MFELYNTYNIAIFDKFMVLKVVVERRLWFLFIAIKY